MCMDVVDNDKKMGDLALDDEVQILEVHIEKGKGAWLFTRRGCIVLFFSSPP